MKYSYSTDQERYYGDFDTPEAAAREGSYETTDDGTDTIYVGTNIPPPCPEGYVDADLLIEHVQNQDPYSHEWAEHWPQASKEQRDELTAAVRRTFAEWLEKHTLRPAFYTVEKVRTFTREQAMKGAE